MHHPSNHRHYLKSAITAMAAPVLFCSSITLIKCYGFKDEAEAMAYPGNPIDTLKPLAKAKVALIHVVGDTDNIVPVAENTALVEQRYKELGGEIKVIHKPGVEHHPHGLEDPTPIVNFILDHNGK